MPKGDLSPDPIGVFYHCLLINDWDSRLHAFLKELIQSRLYENAAHISVHIVFRKNVLDLARAQRILRQYPLIKTTRRMYGMPGYLPISHRKVLMINPRKKLAENESILRMWSHVSARNDQRGYSLFLAGQGVTHPNPHNRGERLFDVVPRSLALALSREEFWFRVFQESLGLISNWPQIIHKLRTEQYEYVQWWQNNFWISHKLLAQCTTDQFLAASSLSRKFGGLHERHSFVMFAAHLKRVTNQEPLEDPEDWHFQWG